MKRKLIEEKHKDNSIQHHSISKKISKFNSLSNRQSTISSPQTLH